jgi:hypothetical protein
MSYVNLEDFQKYTGIIQDENKLTLQSYIDASEEIVEDYLGYAPNIFKLIDNEVVIVDLPYEAPQLIKMTVMRIAALLATESDMNIGITSKSFGEGGGRSFLNTVNFDKYLIQISSYRLIRI